MTKNNLNMCEGPFLKKLILYTIPIILTGVLQLAFNAADLIIVGQFCGSTSMAAVGATSSLTTLIVNFFMGISIGSGVAVAQALGSGHEKAIHNTVHTAIPTALVSGAILTVVGVFFSEQMLVLMGTPEAELPLSALYMRIYFCGITASMVYNFGASILRAAGDTKSPLYYLTAAGFLNVALNTVFVIGFHLDVAGVALATVSSQILSAILVLVALTKRTDACRLNLKKIRFYKEPLKKILRIGIPSGIQSSLFAITNVMIQSTVNSFGSVMLKGNSAAGSVGGFVYTAMHSVYQTAVNFVGQNMGARRFDNIRKVSYQCLGLVAILGLALGALVNLLAEPLLRIYITDSPESIPYGMIRLLYMVLPYFLCGMMDVTTGMLRGMGASLAPMTISILGVCGIRIVWTYTIFPLIPTPECLYIAYPISWIITLTTQFISYKIIFKKQKLQYEKRSSQP